MKKIKDYELVISLSLLCSFLSSMTLSIITIGLPSLEVIGAVIFTLIYFIFYLLFASTIQLVLIKKPKKFHITYLLLYIVGALVASAIGIFIINENPFIKTSYYVTSGLAATIFWVYDSIIVQGKMNKTK